MYVSDDGILRLMVYECRRFMVGFFVLNCISATVGYFRAMPCRITLAVLSNTLQEYKGVCTNVKCITQKGNIIE